MIVTRVLFVWLGNSWLGELSWEDTWWTVKFAGTRLFVESARVKRGRSICLKMYTKSTNLRVLAFLE